MHGYIVVSTLFFIVALTFKNLLDLSLSTIFSAASLIFLISSHVTNIENRIDPMPHVTCQ